LLPDRIQTFFYRTAVGAEIDLLLLVRLDRTLYAIELKHGLAARPQRGFFVICAGQEPYPVAQGVDVLGVREALPPAAGRPTARDLANHGDPGSPVPHGRTGRLCRW
jgi:hypothetical protein